MSNLTLATLAHDKDMARDFLAGLIPRRTDLPFSSSAMAPGATLKFFMGHSTSCGRRCRRSTRRKGVLASL